MGGIEGRAYYGEGQRGSDLRYYQKYIKPELDKQVNPGRLLFQSLGFTAGVAKGDPFAAYDYAQKGGQLFDIIDKSSENAEAYRMRNNAPGDLSGMAYKGPTRIYNN